MRITKSKAIIEKAEAFHALVEKRREIEKAEKLLRDYLRNEIGEDGALSAGNFVILLETRNRTDIDKKLLVEKLGSSVERFYKRSSYQIVNIKHIN